MSRFDYVKYDEKAVIVQAKFKAMFETLESMSNKDLPDGRWHSLFLTHLEYAYMSVGKAIRDDQINRRGAEIREGRSNS